MDIGDAFTAKTVYIGVMIDIWAWMGLTCEVIVATEPAGYWSVVWFSELNMPGRLHAERTVTSKRYIDRSLNVFNFAFVIEMKGLISRHSIYASTLNYSN